MSETYKPSNSQEKTIDANKMLDKIIEEVESKFRQKNKNFWLGVNLNQYEKRLLIGLFPTQDKILDFYSKINRKDIYNIKNQYENKIKRKEVCIPWWANFVGSKLLLPKERDMLWDIVSKVKRFIQEDSTIRKILDNYTQKATTKNIPRGSKKNERKKFGAKDRRGENYRQKKDKLIELLGGKRKMTQKAEEVIKKLKQENDNDLKLLRQKISDDKQFIVDITDDMLGKKMYSFYRSSPSEEKKQALYDVVKKLFLSEL